MNVIREQEKKNHEKRELVLGELLSAIKALPQKDRLPAVNVIREMLKKFGKKTSIDYPRDTFQVKIDFYKSLLMVCCEDDTTKNVAKIKGKIFNFFFHLLKELDNVESRYLRESILFEFFPNHEIEGEPFHINLQSFVIFVGYMFLCKDNSCMGECDGLPYRAEEFGL